MLPEFRPNALCLVLRETRLPQTQRACGAIQVKDGSMPMPEDVNVRRPVIVGKITTHKLPYPVTVGMNTSYHKPKRLGYGPL